MAQPKSYTSDVKVYVDGRLYEPGEVFVTDQPKGKTWESINKAEKAAIDASKPLRGDPPLEKLQLAALQAIAVEAKVDPTDLDKEALIAAIKAAKSATA
jgi:hypothetical protein